LGHGLYDFAVKRCNELVTNDDEQAISLMRILTEIEPGSWEAWYNLGETCRRLSHLEQAELALCRAMDLLQKDVDSQEIDQGHVYFGLGRAYYQMHEYGKAAFFLDGAIPFMPCSFFLHYFLCESLYKAAQWKDVVTEEERYLAQDPKGLLDYLCCWLDHDLLKTLAFMNIGVLAYRLGSTEHGDSCIEQAFLIGAQRDLNESIRETLDEYSLSYNELVGLAEFQHELNRPLDYPEMPASDMELIRRQSEWFVDERSQPCLDFADECPASESGEAR